MALTTKPTNEQIAAKLDVILEELHKLRLENRQLSTQVAKLAVAD